MTVLDGDDRTIAATMFDTGKALQLQHGGSAWAQALDVYDDLIARFRHSHDPLVARKVGDALTWGAYICSSHVSPERALARYQEVIDLFAGRPEEIFRRNLAVAWGSKAIALDKLDRTDERLQSLAELFHRIDYRPWDLSEDETVVSEELAKGALNYGCTLEELGHTQQAMAVWSELMGRFGDDPRSSVLEFVAWAGANLGNTLKNAKRRDEAAAQWNYVVSRFAGIDSPYLQEQVDRARQCLNDLNKPRWRPW
jgi:tetratricopeptide (TPR) repeat protein